MAHVASETTTYVDLALDILIEQWTRVPQVAAEIDSWDLLDRLHFTEEWPLEEDRLAYVEVAFQGGTLSPTQAARYQQVRQLELLYRPILREILELDRLPQRP